MWWETIPSAVIVWAALFAPCVIGYGSNYLRKNGKWENRNWLTNKHDHAAYLRDLYITGSEFIPRGLEAIPDEEK
ncbi:Hypothetical predicted protein [Mytilus galloprovincialis]|uniref:NADH dehydrogenase [ubiquinone] 1 alpha subcomplex subunit 1 n=1 Tax=Mytilus galloprovincialis TaxID=29158 RepID=A0A8B6F900_MYTGA|nr:Hypothetical predicted protein [Mytilus galloprovincialis]